ncbi:MAG: hypothetical protein HYY64_18685 [Candidatus Rokubacteria bacterium]|nr:hypothetical protein [Candidatus Rokubacteria bacterium]
MKRPHALILWGGVLALSAGATSCSQQDRAAVPTIEDKSFTLTPAVTPVKISFLTAELKDVQVVERVDRETGKVTDPPKLRAKLTVKNTSSDQAALVVSGRIDYLDVEGRPIPLAEDRQDPSFTFYGYQERLDPGEDTSQSIEVPFPVAGLKDRKLRDIGLELSYIPIPYREESARISVSLAR